MHPSFKKSSKGGWKSAIFIIFVEVAERFAYYGVSANLFIYLTKVFNQSTISAAKNVNNWLGTSAIFPVVGGFLADSYVGRFNMIIISSSIYFSGLILLTIAVTAVPLHVRPAVFFPALYILSIGEGGHKPCVQTFAADQFDDNNPKEKAAKSSFFNWWYVGIVFGATTSVLVVIYIEDTIGWSVGYGILSAAVFLALILFLVRSTDYRHQIPIGSPFTKLAQVFVAAARKRRLLNALGVWDEIDENAAGGNDATQTLARSTKFRFLDKASMINDQDASGDARNPWRLCPVNQVEETKLVLQLIPLWLTFLMFGVVIAQLGTFFTKQATTLRRNITPSFQVPPASFQVIPGLTILISMLLYERAFIPIARHFTGHPFGITMLQRIGIGLVISIFTMIFAALLETKRVRVAEEYGLLDKPGEVVPMAAWWLILQYVLLGVGDAFAVVGMQELFYDQMPAGMRSVGAAAYLTVVGLGNFLSSALISIVQGISGHSWLGNNINRARLENFYWLLAGMSAVNLCAFVWVSNKFMYKKMTEGVNEACQEMEMEV